MLLFFLHLLRTAPSPSSSSTSSLIHAIRNRASVGFSDDMLCLHACVLFYRRKDADGICANAGWHCLCTIKSQNTLENLNPIKLYDFIFFEFPILLFSRFTFVICAFAWIGLAMDGGWNECYTYDVPVISFTFPSIFTFRWIQTRKPGCSITFVIGRKHIDDGFGIYFSRVHMYSTYTCIFSSICSVYFVTRLSLFS